MMEMNTTDMIGNRTSAAPPITLDQELLILTVKHILYGWIMLPLSLTGLTLNGFTIGVLLHPKMRAFSTNAYLTALSLANCICLLYYVFTYSVRYIVSLERFRESSRRSHGAPPTDHSQEISLGHVYEDFIAIILPVLQPIFNTFQLYAIYLTCTVTIDRWIWLTWPLKADKICTMRNTLRVIAGFFLFSVAYNVPKWFELKTVTTTDPVTNTTMYAVSGTTFFHNALVQKIMRNYAYLIFVYGIPFCTLLVVNIGIIRKLIEAKTRKSHLTGGGDRRKHSNTNLNTVKEEVDGGEGTVTASSSLTALSSSNVLHVNATTPPPTHRGAALVKRTRRSSVYNVTSSLQRLDPKITMMILAVVLAFFLCQFPYLIINIMSLNAKYNARMWFYNAKTVCDVMAALNCCVNFLIYCFFGQNFRQVAKELLFYPSLRPYSRKHIARIKAKQALQRAKQLNASTLPSTMAATSTKQPSSTHSKSPSPMRGNTDNEEEDATPGGAVKPVNVNKKIENIALLKM